MLYIRHTTANIGLAENREKAKIHYTNSPEFGDFPVTSPQRKRQVRNKSACKKLARA